MGIIFPFFANIFINSYKSQIYFYLFVSGCVFAGITVGFLSFIIGKISIIKEVKNLSEQMKVLSNGSGTLDVILDVKGEDEIAEMSINFNRFIKKLSEIISEISSYSNKVSNYSDEVSLQMINIADNSLKQLEKKIL